jgi:hypothetical protein
LSKQQPEFATDSFEMRGVTFKLREISIDRYDELLKQCTEMVDINGVDVERTNEELLLRLVTLDSLLEPKLSASQIRSNGVRFVRTLESRVRALNFGTEPTRDLKSKDTDDEGDQGNAPVG